MVTPHRSTNIFLLKCQTSFIWHFSFYPKKCKTNNEMYNLRQFEREGDN